MISEESPSQTTSVSVVPTILTIPVSIEDGVPFSEQSSPGSDVWSPYFVITPVNLRFVPCLSETPPVTGRSWRTLSPDLCRFILSFRVQTPHPSTNPSPPRTPDPNQVFRDPRVGVSGDDLGDLR